LISPFHTPSLPTGNKMSKNRLSITNVSKYILLCFATTAVLASHNPALSESPPRKWSDASGKFEVTGSILKVNDSEVTLSVEGKGEIQVPIKELCDGDQDYAKGFEMVEQDRKQYQLVMEHIERVRAEPQFATEILLDIHETYPKAPYAAAMLGVARSAGHAEYREARKYLRTASNAIKKRQKMFGEEYQKLTKLAVDNNSAVAALKLANGDVAVKLLESNAQLSEDEINFCTFHNAKLLHNAVKEESPLIKVKNSSRKILAKLIGKMPALTPNFQVGADLLYFVQCSQPMSEGTFNAFHSDSGEAKLPRELESVSLERAHLYADTWCFSCAGKTIIDCSNFYCKVGQIEKRRSVFSHVNTVTGEKVFRIESYHEPCPVCKAVGKLKCPHCINGKFSAAQAAQLKR